MRPDDDRLVPLDGIGGDPVLDALAAELADAGRRARGGADEPRAAFAVDLRARLLAGLPVVAPVVATRAGRAEPGWHSPESLTARPVDVRVVARSPRLLPAPRWTSIVMAAVVLIAIVGLGPSRWQSAPPDVRAGDVAGATLTRDRKDSVLTASTALRDGDLVTTAAGGHATLELGASRARLAGETALLLLDVEGGQIRLEQPVGRAWHRVAPSAAAYVVRTAEVTWTADGTAFDVEIDGDPATGPAWARGVGVEHTVAIGGPDLAATLEEGAVARIRLGGAKGSVPDLALGPLTDGDRHDPWLRDNAARDARLGFDTGVFGPLLAETGPTPAASGRPAEPTSLPAASDDPAEAPGSIAPSTPAAPEPTPTPRRTPRPTPRPTATPKPTPKPTPSLGALGLTATACHGGFTRLAWTVAPADGFDHYQTIRSSQTTIPAVDPPVAPAVAPDPLFAAERSTLAAADSGLEAGSAVSYRTVAFTATDKAYAASSVRTVTAKAVKSLGELALTENGAGFDAAWTPYAGPEGCFGFYKLVVSTTDPSPSYLEGATPVWVGESAAVSGTTVDALDPGTYHVRLQALFDTGHGKVMVAQTDVADVTIP